MSNDEIVPGFDDEKDDALAIGLRRIEGLEGGLVLTLPGASPPTTRSLFTAGCTR
jgi:anti-sigma B factor antagonist